GPEIGRERSTERAFIIVRIGALRVITLCAVVITQWQPVVVYEGRRGVRDRYRIGRTVDGQRRRGDVTVSIRDLIGEDVIAASALLAIHRIGVAAVRMDHEIAEL